MGIELFETQVGADEGARTIKSDETSVLGERFGFELWAEGLDLTVTLTRGDSIDNVQDFELDELARLKGRVVAETTRFCEIVDKLLRAGIAERSGVGRLRVVG
ncbi:hypothetical protein [Nocardia terpenica]|uniref:Uncharacterized protein n=1 Tax=Nocardia terpenica TaxID=455432 RepID=A0A164K7N7_9NOCA|nr:hypothetical protein [Nocardia terpenica]KZM71120.1 hypothetical protein AWN90_42165 [Nocardia terpenica]NQE89556.1 hypothetical protein [Nocardia terpenica]